MKLRPYQEELIDRTRDALKKSRRVLMQGPTGMGKTAISVYMMSRAQASGKSAMFLVHQNELLQQTSRALWDQKLEHGMIASGKRISKLPVQVASVQTLVSRTARYQEPDLIIIDECHRSTSSTYAKILEAYPRARVVGLTATPIRTDGNPLGAIYDDLVIGPSVRQLMDAGFLSEYEIFAPPSTIDLSQIKTKMGDFDKKQLEEEVDRPAITGDAVAVYRKHAAGRRCVVMCVSIRHAEHVRDSYLAAGVSCELIEGKMSNAEREQVLDRFRSGQTMVIAQCELLIAGVDIPAISVVQFLRPTQSLTIWLQAIGRGLRPSEGKDKLLILDHVGNWRRHGLPDDEREWSLEGKKKGKRKAADEELKVTQCQHCFAVFKSGAKVCPKCGTALPVKDRAEIEVVDGDLMKLDIEAQRVERKKEQGQARTLRDLIELGLRRGLKKPAEWAVITLAARHNRKPTATEFSDSKKMLARLKHEAANGNQKEVI